MDHQAAQLIADGREIRKDLLRLIHGALQVLASRHAAALDFGRQIAGGDGARLTDLDGLRVRVNDFQKLVALVASHAKILGRPEGRPLRSDVEADLKVGLYNRT